MSWTKEKHKKHGAEKKVADSLKRRLSSVLVDMESAGYRLGAAHFGGCDRLCLYHDSLSMWADEPGGALVESAIIWAIPCDRVDG